LKQKPARAAQGTSTAVQATATSRMVRLNRSRKMAVKSCQESKQGSLQESGLGKKSRNLLFLTLSWLNNQAFVVHFVHVARRFHMFQNPLLEINHRVERIRYVLILLYVANDFGSLGSFRKIDQLRVLDDRCNAVFDEGQICQVYSYRKLITNGNPFSRSTYPKMECMAGWPGGAFRDKVQSSSCSPSVAALIPEHRQSWGLFEPMCG
jgi:hypothetical protein